MPISVDATVYKHEIRIEADSDDCKYRELKKEWRQAFGRGIKKCFPKRWIYS
jgi:hypothetical protein